MILAKARLLWHHQPHHRCSLFHTMRGADLRQIASALQIAGRSKAKTNKARADLIVNHLLEKKNADDNEKENVLEALEKAGFSDQVDSFIKEEERHRGKADNNLDQPPPCWVETLTAVFESQEKERREEITGMRRERFNGFSMEELFDALDVGEGRVYLSDGVWLYPDGSLKDES